MLRPGGVGFDAEPARVADLLKRLDAADKDTANAWNCCGTRRRDGATGRARNPCQRRSAKTWASSDPPHVFGPEPRRAQRPTVRHLSLHARARLHLEYRRCLCPRVCSAGWKSNQSIVFIREQLHSLPHGVIQAKPASLAPNRLRRFLDRGMARRTLPRGDQPNPAGRFARTRSSIRRFTTGRAWPTRCATSRSPISRSATRASICPTCGHDL